MGFGDFLHEQVNNKIQDVRDNRHIEHEREAARRSQVEDEFRGQQQSVAEEFQEEIREAQKKADEIYAMPMPENYQEFTKMVMECGRNLDKPLTKSALAVRMAGYDTTSMDVEELDFELPAKTIKKAWDTRMEQMLQYGASAFSSNPNYEAFVKPYLKKTEKFQTKRYAIIIVSAFVGIFLVLSLMVYFG